MTVSDAVSSTTAAGRDGVSVGREPPAVAGASIRPGVFDPAVALVDSWTRRFDGYRLRVALDDSGRAYDLTIHEGDDLRATVTGLPPAWLEVGCPTLVTAFLPTR
jgi:hypothetical protein